jgi:MFS family permease
MAFAPNAATFFALRFLLGVAEAGFYPGIILFLTSWFPTQHRTSAISIFQWSVPLAGVLGGPLSGWIMEHFDKSMGMHGWQWLFILESAPAAILAVVVWFCITNSIDDARWLNDEDKAILKKNLEDTHTGGSEFSFKAVLGDSQVWKLSMVVFGLTMGLYAISFWLPTLLHQMGDNLTLSEIGWLSAVPNLAPIAVMYFFAQSSDRTQERRWHVASAALIGAIGLILSVLTKSNLALAITALSLAACGIMSALPLQWGLFTTSSRSARTAASVAFINSLGNLGGIASPLVIGWLADTTRSTNAGIFLVAGFICLSAIVATSFPARTARR